MRYHLPGSLAVAVVLVIILCITTSGCTGASSGNLTKKELGDAYLAKAGTIHDYRSVLVRPTGFSVTAPFTETIRYDMKSPGFYRMEYTGSSEKSPGSHARGSFTSTNQTTTGFYESDTGIYHITDRTNYLSEYDYQSIVRQIIKDDAFIIIGKETIDGHTWYGIEVVSEPYSDKYTHYIWSKIQAWIDPETGLAGNISTYYPKESVNNIIRYDSIVVNTGIPDQYFDFYPPAGARPMCNPKYAHYVLPPLTNTSIPISEPMPGARYSLNESDSGRVITLHTGDTFEITLRYIPTLAYRWLMPVTGTGLELMNGGGFSEMPKDVDRSKDGVYFHSLPGKYRLRYMATAPGTSEFDGVFSLDECNTEGVPRFNLTVNVV